MPKFAFGDTIGDCKRLVISKLGIGDTLKFLAVNRGLRHFILIRGPLDRKRFKNLDIMIHSRRSAEDPVIASSIFIHAEHRVGDMLSLTTWINGDDNSDLDNTFHLQDIRTSETCFLNMIQDVAFCCQRVVVNLARISDDVEDGSSNKFPFDRLFAGMRTVQSFSLINTGILGGPRDAGLDFHQSCSFLKKYPLPIMENFHVSPGLFNQELDDLNKEEMFHIMKEMLPECSMLELNYYEKLLLELLPSLTTVKTLFLHCSPNELKEWAWKLMKEDSYHHLSAVFLLCEHGFEKVSFDRFILQILGDETMTRCGGDQAGKRSRQEAIELMRPKLWPHRPAMNWEALEETVILARQATSSSDQTRYFVLKRGFEEYVYFYAKFE